METYWGTSVSGCKDDEDLDDLVLARPSDIRPSCAAASNEYGGGKNKASSNRKSSLKVGMKRSWNSIRESGRGVKRCQPAVSSGSVKVQDSSESGPLSNMKENNVQGVQFMAKDVDAEKSGADLLGQRFKDVPAMVPIKKRRIHMVEVVRSPSPPPRSLSPGIGSPPPSLPSSPPPPLSGSPRCPSSLARMSSLSSQPSKLCSPRLQSPESRSPLSSSPVPLSMLSSLKSSSPGPRSLPSSSQTPLARSPSVGSANPISHHLPNLVSSECELNADGGKFTLTCSGRSQMVEGDKQGLSVQLSLLETQLPSSTLLSDGYNTSFVVEEEEGFTSAKGCPDVEDLDVVAESEESAREAMTNSAVELVDQHLCIEGIQGVSGRLKSGLPQDDRLHWDLNMEMEAWERLKDQTAVTEVEDKISRELPCTSISVESYGSKHNEKAEALVELQANDGHGSEKCVDFGTSECGDEVYQSVEAGEMMSMVSRDESDWKAEGAAENVEFDNPASWEGETASDGEADEKSWMEEVPQNDAQVGLMADSKLERNATSSRTKAAGWDQLSGEVDAEENVDYGDSEWRDVDDVGLDVAEKASVVLQADINWRATGETDNVQDNSACQEVDTVSNEVQEKSGLCEEGLKVSCCDSQLSETSLEKDGNSGRSKFTGWDQLPEGFENVEEAWKVVTESSSHNVGGRPWASSRRRGSFFNSRGTRRGNRLGSGHSASRVSYTSVRGERVFCDPVRSNERLYARKSFDHGMWMDDSCNGSSKLTSSDSHPGGKFGRGRSVSGFHGMNRANTWTEPGGTKGKWSSGHGHANAAAVAAAKVESSGFVVAADGTITKAGRGSTSSRGGVQSMTAGRRGAHRSLTDISKGRSDVEAAVKFPSRGHVGPGRGMVGTSSRAGMNRGGRGFGPNARQGHMRSMTETGKLGGQRVLDKYEGPLFGSGGMEHERRESPNRFLHPWDHSCKDGHTSPSFRPDFKVEKPNTPRIHHSLGHSKLVLTGMAPSQGSSSLSSKWSGEKRETEMLTGQDFKQALPRPCLSLRRTSPYAAYGSSSMDGRDQQVFSEAGCSVSLRGGLNSAISTGKFGNCSPEIRGSRQNEEDGVKVTASKSREVDYSRTSPNDYNKDRLNKDNFSKRNVLKHKDRRRDSSNLPGKDGRSIRSHKRVSTWEEEDDVAPRRRRPS